jgi:hypothetical protein
MPANIGFETYRTCRHRFGRPLSIGSICSSDAISISVSGSTPPMSPAFAIRLLHAK